MRNSNSTAPQQANPVALITGSSRGLGATLAGFLASQGFDLVLTGRNPETLGRAAEALTSRYARIEAVPGDVADADHRRRLADAARRFGRLDLLVNNASTLGAAPLPPLAEYPLETFERVLAVNLIAPLGLIQETLPLLQTSSGLVVNISSDAAIGGYPGWGGYGASKAALDTVSRTLGNEFAEHGISVVSVDPGDMRTDMHKAAFPGEDISDRPPPEVTLPFWAWLFGRSRTTLKGQRFEAQGELWEDR